MTNDTILPFSFPAVSRKKITAAFDGGRLTSNGGVMLLAMADRRVGVAEKLSCVFPERRDPARITAPTITIMAGTAARLTGGGSTVAATSQLTA